ncbi:hypothetical protein GGH13_007002, partial [Coemansia sp. S155-1]
MERLSKRVQECILSLLDHGLSSRRVAKIVGDSKSAVVRLSNAMRPNIFHLRAGRPRLLSQRNKAYLTRLLTSGKLDTATQATKDLRDEVGKT